MNKLLFLLFVISIFLLSSSIVSATLSGSLKHHYTFDETSGTTLYDSMKLKNATATNNDMLGASGIINNSVYSSAYTRSINFNGITGMKSINVWVYAMGTNAMPIFFEDTLNHIHINNKWSSNQPSTTSLGMVVDNKFYSWTQSDLGLTNQYFPTNEWSMISIVWNNSANTYYASVNNGSLVASTEYNSPSEGLDWGNFYFAKYTSGDNTNMRIDELSIFNASITQEDISILYNSGAGLSYPFTTMSEPETLKNITFRLYDNTSSSLISGYTLYYNNNNSLSPFNDLILELDHSILYNLTYTKPGYYNSSYNNINISNITTYTGYTSLIPVPEANMTNVSFSVDDSITNNSITGFSVLINSGEYSGSTTSTILIISMPEDNLTSLLYNITYSKFGYYSNTYDNINLSGLNHTGVLVPKSYVGDESLDDKSVIWIILAIVGGIGIASIFSRFVLPIFGFSIMFLTYFLSQNIFINYYWFSPLGYIIGMIIVFTGLMRLGFND